MTIEVDPSKPLDLRAYRPKDLSSRLGGSAKFWRELALPWRKLGARTLVVLHDDLIAFLDARRTAASASEPEARSA